MRHNKEENSRKNRKTERLDMETIKKINSMLAGEETRNYRLCRWQIDIMNGKR